MSKSVKMAKRPPWVSAERPIHQDLAALLWIWLRHPDPDVRQTADALLSELEELAGPRHSISQVVEVLNAEQGTALDPFRLSPDSLQAAARMTRLAFSERYDQRTMRVVPDTTIGVAGGLLIDGQLSTDYFPRSILEGNRRTPWASWYLAPRELLEAVRPSFEVSQGTIGPDGSSFVILRVPVPDGPTLEAVRESLPALGGAGRLGNRTLKSLGLHVSLATDGQLSVEAASPEAMILVATALGEGTILQMRSHSVNPGFVIAASLPGLLPAEPRALPTLVGSFAQPDPPAAPCDIQVTPPEALVLAAWPHIILPPTWLTPSVLEKIVEAI